MIERILKHMNIYREMKNAAIPLKLIGKKGEDSCMNAALSLIHISEPTRRS